MLLGQKCIKNTILVTLLLQAASGRNAFPEIQRVRGQVFVIWDLNSCILNKVPCNSSLTRSDGFVLDSSRSGAIFWPCVTSLTYSSIIAKQCIFGRGQLPFCVSRPQVSTPSNPFVDPAV